MRVRLAALAALGLLPLRGASADSLGVDPTDPRFVGRGDLVLKLRTSVHDYFRFVNAGFAAETCSLFADVVDQMPEVNLHGDAHIEQYTVTNIGRGLSDFDRTHRLVVSYRYDLPIAKGDTGFRRAALADWTISGISNLSGYCFNRRGRVVAFSILMAGVGNLTLAHLNQDRIAAAAAGY